MASPLSGLKILDFTYLLPGPYGSMMLADMGADIIKVENRNAPDMARFMPPFINGVSALYAHLNRGKRSMSIDLKKKQGADIVRSLVREYDIVLEQFRPGVMARLGLGYEDLKQINPAVIYCSLTGYGQNGPYADRAGHDINYCALSGIESYSGRRDTGPCPEGIQIADICGGSKNLAIGVLAAYISRTRTGRGDHVDISMADSAFALTVFSAAGYLAGAREPGREAELFNGGSMYDFYETSDRGYLSVGPVEQKFFAGFCSAIGVPELAPGGIMANLADPAAKGAVARLIREKPLSHWRRVFSSRDACVEPVLSLGEACGSDLFRQRGMIVTLSDGAGGSFVQIGNPVKFASGDCLASVPGGCGGNDKDSVLGSLGYSGDEIQALKDSGIV